MQRSTTAWIAVALSAALLIPPVPALQDTASAPAPGEPARGAVELLIPSEEVDALVAWFDERFGDAAQIEAGGRQLKVTVTQELVVDRYFDDGDLSVLRRAEAGDGGLLLEAVRHRGRAAVDGGGDAEVGLEYVQLLDGQGLPWGLGVARTQYEVDAPAEQEERGDRHPLLGLLPRLVRPEAEERLRQGGVRFEGLRHALTVTEQRRTATLADAAGPLANVALVRCSCTDRGEELAWVVLGLAAAEARYGRASAAEKGDLDRVLGDLEREVVARVPAAARAEAPRYVQAFHRLDRATVLPLATMHRWRVSAGDLAAGGLLLVLAVFAVRYHARRVRPGWGADAMD